MDVRYSIGGFLRVKVVVNTEEGIYKTIKKVVALVPVKHLVVLYR